MKNVTLQELKNLKQDLKEDKMKASKPYFSHDIATKSDEKIIRLMFDFRKNKKEFPEHILQELVPHAAYAIYWEIIEYLHENTLKVNELEMLSDVLRVDLDILEKILNNYELFKIKDGAYISERVLRNLKLQEEKSEKARQSANKRHSKNKKNNEYQNETISEPEYNEEITMSIIRIYNDKFKKSQIVSKENKHRVYKIHTENNLTLDTWNKVFSNAKRGWDIGDKKNVKPSLPLILDKWDSFASDDYFLAPDRESAAEKAAQIKLEEAKEKAEKERIRKIEDAERENAYNSITNKEECFEYMCKYCPSLKKIDDNKFIRRNATFKELSEKYNFGIDEFKEYRADFLLRELEVNND